MSIYTPKYPIPQKLATDLKSMFFLLLKIMAVLLFISFFFARRFSDLFLLPLFFGAILFPPYLIALLVIGIRVLLGHDLSNMTTSNSNNQDDDSDTYHSSSSDTFNSCDGWQSCHTNPANGAPLTGDCGSIDVFGNPYGTSGCD